jgi:hypothetical protein
VSNVKRAVTACRVHATAMAHAVRAQPTLVAVAAEGFLTRLGFSMIGFALPLYALSLGMGVAEIGLLYALRTVTTLGILRTYPVYAQESSDQTQSADSLTAS